MNFVTDVSKFTKEFPKDEIYGLASQIGRSCSFVPSNIAEGAGRKGTKKFYGLLMALCLNWSFRSSWQKDWDILIRQPKFLEK